jgi:hypothetical protein
MGVRQKTTNLSLHNADELIAHFCEMHLIMDMDWPTFDYSAKITSNIREEGE